MNKTRSRLKVNNRPGDQLQQSDVTRAYQALVPAMKESKTEYYAIAKEGYPGARLVPDEVPGLTSVGVLVTRDKQTFSMQHFRLQGVMLVMTLQGCLPVKTPNNSFLLGPGEITIFCPGTHFAVGDPEASCARLSWMLFDVQAEDQLLPWFWPDWLMMGEEERQALERQIRDKQEHVMKATPEFFETFKRLSMLSMLHEVPHRRSRLKQLISMTMLELLEMLQGIDRGEKATISPSQASVLNFLSQLPERLAETWTIERMAESCGLGVSKFSQQVNFLMAESPAKHLARLRLEKAKSLLLMTTLPLSDIARQTGFSSVSYFIRSFTRYCRLSPTHFRRKAARQDVDRLRQ